MTAHIVRGDARALPLPDASVDAVCTDPPYELPGGFMGKRWDRTGVAFDVATWREALRVLKPGGFLAAFGGTRTAHRLACGIEDAGFELRDSMAWIFGSGFPKSAGHLKPGHEPIVLARKPLAGTVAANVLAYGTGALNIDACRIGAGGQLRWEQPRDMGYHGGTDAGPVAAMKSTLGRWPTNVVFTHLPLLVDGEPVGDACADDCAPGCPVAELDAQSGHLKSGLYEPHHARNVPRLGIGGTYGDDLGRQRETPTYGDSGGASRFFPTFRYQAKAPGAERPRLADGTSHPTVKPLALMRWLVRLITPPGGIVLDPFAGSGTTLEAARAEGMRALGVELDPASVGLATVRLTRPAGQRDLRAVPAPVVEQPPPTPAPPPIAGQLDLLGDVS